MTDTPNVPDNAATDNAAEAVDEIIEVIFEDHYWLAIAAFVAGALIVAGIVYYIGSRNIESENENAAD